MPRIDHHADVSTALTPQMQMVLTLLMQEINQLRQRAGLPQRTPHDVRQAIRDALRGQHPHAGGT